MPKAYRLFAGLLHAFIIEMISAIPVIAVAGIGLGYLVKKKAIIYGGIAVVCFFMCETIYGSILFKQLIFSHWGPNIWYTLSTISAWIFLFILMVKIGTRIG